MLSWLFGTRTDGDAAKSCGHPRDPRWPRVRAAWLADHGTCAACGGTKDLQVHHKMPFSAFPHLELDPTNFLTLCESPTHSCHFTFGHFFDWKRHNPGVVADAARFLAALRRASL